MPGVGQADQEIREREELLRSLGFSTLEAAGLAHLLRQECSPSELAGLLGVGPKRAASLLTSMLRRGLVKRLPGRAVRYAAVPPSIVLPALLERERERIEALQRRAQSLIDSHRSARRDEGPATEYVEVIAGIDAIRDQFETHQSTAQSEVLGCTKLPILVTPFAGPNPGEEAALEKGVQNRWLYEQAIVELPGVMEHINRFATLGEESRVTPSLPSKFFVIDRKLALIHATEEASGEVQVVGVVMRHPELVETLRVLFQILWERATPLGSFARERQPADEDTQLLDALAAGMKDEAVARHLGISERTMRRRMSELMDRLAVSSRFQAGFELGRRSSMRDGS